MYKLVFSVPSGITLLTPLVNCQHEKDPHEGRLILPSGAGPHSWAGGATRAPGSGLWLRTIHRWGEQGLVICCLGSGAAGTY